MSLKNIKWTWVIVFGIGVFILGWEMMALMNSEDAMPTWSRMIWILQMAYPWFKYVVPALVVLIVFGFGAWLLIHFWVGLPELRNKRHWERMEDAKTSEHLEDR